jgi:predicted exporter
MSDGNAPLHSSAHPPSRAQRTRRFLPLLLWALLLALTAEVVAHARYRADLSAFLPRSPTPMQQLLVQQISNGPASHLILIGIDGVDPVTRSRLSDSLSRQLAHEPEFVAVTNGEENAAGPTRRFAFEHRYLLSSDVTAERFSAAGLHAAIADSLSLMASPAGLLMRGLFQNDPTGETLQVIDQLDQGTPPHKTSGVWSSPDGRRALLIAQTRASGADTDGQQTAIAQIRVAFARAVADLGPSGTDVRSTAAVLPHAATGAAAQPAPSLQLTGPGVFSVQARDTIKRQAIRLSLVSTSLIIALLLCAYRSLPVLLFGLLPVASGALAGVAAVALGFGVVQGITLGFGITLIGESVDYPVYLFIQSRGGHPAAVLWPTITLGALTSICGFATLLPSNFPGLAQLGLYSIAGLIVAAAVTRWVLPSLLPRRLSMADLAPLGEWARQRLAHLHLPLPAGVAVALACVAVLITSHSRLWNHDLAALSPIPAADLELDARMRAQLGAPDVSNLVLISAAGEQQVLAIAEAADRQLDALVGSAVIGGYDSPAHYLPSRSTQLARLASLPDAQQLQSRLRAATKGLPLQAAALSPFVQQVQAARAAGPITRASLQGTSLGLAVDALLWQQAGRWQALLPLHPPHTGADIDIAAVRKALQGIAPGRLLVINTRAQSDALYDRYLATVLRLSLWGLVAIVALLAFMLRSPARVMRVIAPLLLAVLLVAATFALLGVPMTILHLIGMLLIVAVGSNYALFFDRSAAQADRGALPRTLASLLVANACTVLGFAVLAFSSVPVLSALGRTVAPGALLALWLAALWAPRALYEVPHVS